MLLPEWNRQKGVVLAFPDTHTDWSDYLEEARACVVEIVKAIAVYETVYLLCTNREQTIKYFDDTTNIKCIKAVYDDTWMRDCIALSCDDGIYRDFRFTGWGGKFDAHNDNDLNLFLEKRGVTTPLKSDSYILEGGALESDGNGVILTTSSCLLNSNRNLNATKENVEERLAQSLGAQKVLWLDHGELEGDDTDGHIDTIARFCDEKTIAYVGLPSKDDTHYESFKAMEEQLKSFTNIKGEPYTLVALPFVPAMYYDNERLPATYANFLIINGAVLVPTYGVKEDEEALAILKSVFSDREVIGIDCQVLVRQHGSLHCMTMQLI